MMRSLYSAVSGIKTHQTKMDVIGNNVANVNTVAFKSSSVTFNEIMYQTISGASGANATTGTGGVNAKQIGLGVSTGSTKISISTAGASETTGNPFDIKLTDANSTNFFVVSNGTSNMFTRAGSFYVDGSGNLAMTSTGYTLQGWQVDETTGEIKKDTVSALRILQEKNLTSNAEATTNATITGIVDKNDESILSTDGYTMNLNFYDALGYTYTAKFAVKASDTATGTYTVELTSILDENNSDILASYVAGGGAITDIFGDAGTGNYELKYDPDNGGFQYVDGTGTTSVNLNLTAALGGNFSDISVDFSQTKNSNNSGSATIGAVSGAADGSTGKGKALGNMTGITISNDGKIYGTYDNGNTELLGQVAVAQFANASGLEKVGDNCYIATLNSGDFDGVGIEISADGSTMSAGELEMSNVDLAAEFTQMIITQRGYQANSRVITTSDTLLEELINLKR